MQENAVIKNIKKNFPIHMQKNAEIKRTLLVHTQKNEDIKTKLWIVGTMPFHPDRHGYSAVEGQRRGQVRVGWRGGVGVGE